MLEELLAYHCAPALAGIKPANIAACKKLQFDNLYQDIETLNSQLNKKDIYVEMLCECEKRALLIVYRKTVLEKHLQIEENRRFLSFYGYPEKGTIEKYFNVLRKKLDCDNFPHEIGVFLGYPLNDIYSFINHRDEGCLLIGEWKVYHNVESAQKMFSRFASCRKALTRHVTQNGRSLAQIFCVA